MQCTALSRVATITSAIALTLFLTSPAARGATGGARDSSPADPGALGEVAPDTAENDGARLVALPERPRRAMHAGAVWPSAPSALPVKISGPMTAGGDVVGFEISPDGSTVVYLADQESNGAYHLYAVPVGGGTPLRLTEPPGMSSAVSFLISPDSAKVVYWYDYQLYSVDITGGASAWLNADLLPWDDVFWQSISPDSTTVVFTARDQLNMYHLYSVPISGGATTRLNTSPLDWYNETYYRISSDGSRVLYRSSSRLYSVPITGGTPLLLSGPLVAGGAMTGFSEFLGTTIYYADQATDSVHELYSVPTAGGAWVKLNGPLTTGGDVNSWSLSYDTVYYRADQETDEVSELYGVPKQGGTVVKLSGPLTTGGDVGGYQPTDDEAYAVYLADQDTDEIMELYSVPGSGGSTTRLNGALTAEGDVLGWAIVGRVDMAGYIADQDTDEMVEVYGVPVSGGTAGKCSGAMVAEGDVSAGSIDWSGLVWYLADQDTDEVLELYLGSLDASVAPSKLNGPLVAGGDVEAYGIASPWTVYLADQDTDEVMELYSVMLDGDIDLDGTIDGLDCIVFDPDVWDFPGDSTDLALSGLDPTTLSWTAPVDLGGTSVVYDTVRSTDPGDFGPQATCVEPDDGADTLAYDDSTPAGGEVFFYLVRTQNICGGVAGVTSTGVARSVRDCS